MPDGFSPELTLGRAVGTVDVMQDTPDRVAGVTILEGVRPVGAERTSMRPWQLARWVAERPQLSSSTVVRGAVDGLRAWSVDVRLLGDSTSTCNGQQDRCFALLSQPVPGGEWETGPWRDMVSRYTFVELPDDSTAVIWSWAFRSDRSALAMNDQLIRTLSFHPGG